MVGLLKRAPFNAVQVRSRATRMYCWRHQEMWAGAAGSIAEKYIETGVRPFEAPDTIPVAIRIAAGDDSDPTDVSDLLGDPSGGNE